MLQVSLNGVVYPFGVTSKDAFTRGGVGRFLGGGDCFYFDIFLKWRVQLFIAYCKAIHASNTVS